MRPAPPREADRAFLQAFVKPNVERVRSYFQVIEQGKLSLTVQIHYHCGKTLYDACMAVSPNESISSQHSHFRNKPNGSYQVLLSSTQWTSPADTVITIVDVLSDKGVHFQVSDWYALFTPVLSPKQVPTLKQFFTHRGKRDKSSD